MCWKCGVVSEAHCSLFKFIFIHTGVAFMYVMCTTLEPATHGGQERIPAALEMAMQMGMNYHAGAELQCASSGSAASAPPPHLLLNILPTKLISPP